METADPCRGCAIVPPCGAPVPSPTRIRLDLPPLAAGVWNLTFGFYGRISKAALSVTDSGWAIRNLATGGVDFESLLLRRALRGLTWGNVTSPDSTLELELEDSPVSRLRPPGWGQPR